jgi:hypothetical protein
VAFRRGRASFALAVKVLVPLLTGVLAPSPAGAAAAELPFGQHVTPADRQLVLALLKEDPVDVNPQRELQIAKIDLNADGRLDYVAMIVNLVYCGSGGCATSVFLAEGTGYRQVLDILVHDIGLGDGRTGGMSDLVLDRRSRWVWNGKAYAAAPAGEFKMSDELPDDTPEDREPTWKNDRLARLARFIGTGAYTSVLKDPEVESALAALMSPADLKTLVINLGMSSVIGYLGGNLVLEGFRPHAGGQEMAAVWINLRDATVRAAMLHEGRVHLFARDARYGDLPAPLRRWIRSPVVPDELPPTVIWKR